MLDGRHLFPQTVLAVLLRLVRAFDLLCYQAALAFELIEQPAFKPAAVGQGSVAIK